MWNWIVANKEWIFSGVGIAIVGLAVAVFKMLRAHFGNSKEVGADVRYFKGPTEGRYNHDFYTFFTKRIATARSDVYITGDGFEIADEEGKGVAERFISAFRQALNRNVRVVRVQTRAEPHHEWAQMLAKLREEFPSTFDLYVLREGKVSQMSSVCVIDPEEPRHSIVEIMLSTQKLFGTRAADVAGTAVFIEGSSNLAVDLRNRILSLTQADVAIHPKTDHEILEALSSSELYFAYGSNMCTSQMTKRAAKSEVVAIGFLPDHQLVFNRKGSYRPGGVASVEKASGKRVYGVIWSISPMDLASLDESEDPKAYQRISKEVFAVDGTKHFCHIYEAFPTGSYNPDPDYLAGIVNAAEEMGLPDAYVEELKTLDDSGETTQAEESS